MVIVIIGVIAAIAMPRFADAGSGRRLSAAKRLLTQDVESIQLRARVTGKTHTIVFYPSSEMYVAFEGTDIKRDAIVLSRDLTIEPLTLELSRTTIGGDHSIVVSPFGDLEKGFTIGLIDDGTEIAVVFASDGFTRPTVTVTDAVVDIKSMVDELKLISP